jgi:transposase
MRHDTSPQSLTLADRRRLLRALSSQPLARVYRRIEALLLIAEGHSVSEAARRVRSNRSSVHRWMARYLERHDPAALLDAPRAGRPEVAPELSAEQIGEVLGSDPRTLGYASTTWTVPLLARHLQQLGQPVSERTLRRRLHALGYRWKRPRHRYISRPSRRERGAKKGL